MEEEKSLARIEKDLTIKKKESKTPRKKWSI